jgi:branched-chain amino acid transport system permease protein
MIVFLASAAEHGLAIAALALAFALVYWSTRIFFVALGAIHVAAPFLVEGLCQPLGATRAAVAAAVAAAVVAGGGLALLAGWLNHEHLVRRGAPTGVHFAASLAVYYILSEVAKLLWGAQVLSLAPIMALSPRLAGGGASWPPLSQLAAIAACLTLVVTTSLALRHSGQGIKLRALADNPAELARCGASPVALRAAAFGAAGLLAAATAVAVASDLSLGIDDGLQALMPAATAVLLTPAGRWRWLLVCALALGLLRKAATLAVSGAWQDPLTLGLLLLVLVARRAGERRWGGMLAPRGRR